MNFKSYQMRLIIHILFLGFFLGTTSSSEIEKEPGQWTRFRGVNGSGNHIGGGIPSSWDNNSYLWRIDLQGSGHASPVVWGDKIFVTSAEDTGHIGYVICVDAADGTIFWQKEFGLSALNMHVDNNLASASPTVDETSLYCIWYTREKIILTALSHKGVLQWESVFDGIETRHGGGSSLMQTDTDLIFTREQENGSSFSSSWVAVDKKTGNTRWELGRETTQSNSFSTPTLVEMEDKTEQLIFTSEAHGFSGVEPQSGKLLWERKGLLPHRVVASPVFADGIIIGCRKGEAVALGLDRTTKVASDTALYRLARNISPYVPTPIVVDGLLFLFTDNGTVVCVELFSGEVLWKERPAGPIYGSPICVEGKLYCMTKAGKILVIGATSEYQLSGIQDLGEASFSTPVVCESGMVFRTLSQLSLLAKQE